MPDFLLLIYVYTHWRGDKRVGVHINHQLTALYKASRDLVLLFLSLAPFYCLSVSVVTLSLSLMGAVELQLIMDVNGPEE